MTDRRQEREYVAMADDATRGSTDTGAPVRVFGDVPGARGWLVWAHGGSWRSGSVAEWAVALDDLARTASVRVVGVDYRLAPQHPYPAALLDVLSALEWAQERAGQGEPVSVGGDSAGATLAACAAVVRRDRQQPLAAQALAYPPLDPHCRAASYTNPALLGPSRTELLDAWQTYRGSATPDPALPLTPYEKTDLSRLAPAVVAVGLLDPVLDDVRGYARRLLGAGCDVDLRQLPDTGHGVLHTDAELREWLGEALKEATGTGR
ncbi:alpha/beta hydrolase fold domain-containing protein [Actinomycetota bacterium Odt1-20B]